ncbi:camp-regulated phosphoprotein/endosulfine conserved region-domain-containing protein [Crassisporium funariophilum]|nr:camp-regulated phosphoprotein/endosulfine conserved region-domain-containing protein [Crassisporium funariophilum]
MLPFQRNKVDISKLSPQEQQLFAKYGKLPTHKSVLMKMQKDRKYFDSGDYALSKAGVAPQSTVGTAIPNPENIPHASSPGNGHNSSNGHQSLSISPTNSMSPVNKESGLAHNENTNVPEDDPMAADSAPVADPAAPAEVTPTEEVETVVAETQVTV